MATALAPLPIAIHRPSPPPPKANPPPSFSMAATSSRKANVFRSHTSNHTSVEKACIEHVNPHASTRTTASNPSESHASYPHAAGEHQAERSPVATSVSRVQRPKSSTTPSADIGSMNSKTREHSMAQPSSSTRRPHHSPPRRRVSNASTYQQIAGALIEHPPAFLKEPPPLPPKSEYRQKHKAVSIVAPSAISQEGSSLRHSASDPGHTYVTPASSSGVPNRRKAVFHSQTLSNPSPYSSRLTWADTAHVALYGSSFTEQGRTASSSLSHAHSVTGRRRLRKLSRPPLPPPSVVRSVPSASSSHSKLGSGSLWRAVSLRNSGAIADSSRRPCNPIHRQTKSEDGHISGVSACPQTQNSNTASEGSHSSSSNSSSITSPLSSTPPTTPEWDPSISPVIFPSTPQDMLCSPLRPMALPPLVSSPKGSRKLKKRPPHPPSAMMRSLSGRSSSFQADLRNIKKSSGSLAISLPPVRPEAPLGLDIPKALQVQPISPSQPSFEDTNRSSSHALSQLAWTGLCSSDFAALTSRLSVRAHSPERAALMAAFETEMGVFDPYVEYVSHMPSDTRLSVESTRGRENGPPHGRRRMSSPARMAVPSSRSSSVSYITSEPHPRASTTSTAVRGRADQSPTMTMRRWTVAMADVSDEVLVAELDRLRKESAFRMRGQKHSRALHGHDSDAKGKATSVVYGGPGSSEARPKSGFHFAPSYESESDEECDDTIDEEHEMASPEDEEEWKAARRALLCCRELVRTERNYQARLRQLLESESSHSPFSLVLKYVPALLTASEAFLVRLIDDPSAWGVSAAFISCEEELEAAYVAWCGSVGEFFAEGEEKEKRGRKPTRPTPEETASTAETAMHSIARTVSTFGVRSRSQSGLMGNAKPKSAETRPLSMFSESITTTRTSGLFTAALGTGLALGLAPVPPPFANNGNAAIVGKASSGHAGGTSLTRTLSAWKRKSMPSSLHVFSQPPSPISPQPGTTPSGTNGTEKKFTVRDLAIQPTQRVMRYVLQYRDLLEHTPISSPSRGLVERALESALRIAKKCDRAQGNSTFLRRP